jgi:hypothetical protein
MSTVTRPERYGVLANPEPARVPVLSVVWTAAKPSSEAFDRA